MYIHAGIKLDIALQPHYKKKYCVMNKIMITLGGGLLTLIGLIFMIIPGPGLPFVLLGLIILSFEYPLAKVWLRKCQKLMSKGARWLDAHLRKRKYR